MATSKKKVTKKPKRKRLSEEERAQNIELELDPDDDRPLAQKIGEHISWLMFLGKPVPEKYPRILEHL